MAARSVLAALLHTPAPGQYWLPYFTPQHPVSTGCLTSHPSTRSVLAALLHTPAPGQYWLPYFTPQHPVSTGCLTSHLSLSGLLMLTPSLPQPVKCPCCKMYGCSCKQSVFRSNNNLFSMVCVLMQFLSHASAKKKTERPKGFRFRTFIGRF